MGPQRLIFHLLNLLSQWIRALSLVFTFRKGMEKPENPYGNIMKGEVVDPDIIW